jgi:hypothetical protein
MKELFENNRITYLDKAGNKGQIRYGDLNIQMGENRRISLAACLQEEQERVEEFQENANKLSKKIRALDCFYDEIEKDIIAFYSKAYKKTQGINDLPFEKRIRLLNNYYTVNDTHDRILQELCEHMLEGSEGELSAHIISLVRVALDYTCRVMRGQPRKNKRPAALHAIEAARGAAKNGLRPMTIIATLLHDVLEERLDDWTEKLINCELNDSAYGEHCGKKMKQIPVALRHQIIQKHIDAYNDRATGIYFMIGLTLYNHVCNFPSPARHYETLRSITEMVAGLSRRRDNSYYSYLQGLLYPKPNNPEDTISRRRLIEELKPECVNVEKTLDSYLENVHNFYQTKLFESSAKEEVRRNAFREIIAKILDRLNNTRDLDRRHGFTIPRRMYGTGFKNIFFLQAIEDKFRRPSFNTEERRLIEIKFINKPKVAALYQILDDIEQLKKEHDLGDTISKLEKEIEDYKTTRAFRRLTPPDKDGHFNGLIYLFNDITLGKKSNLDELEKDIEKQAEVLVAFKAILESFLVYQGLIHEDMEANQLRSVDESCFQSYRIEGMGPTLEQRSDARKDHAVDLLDLKSFSRTVI